ncbi:hypothetical protein M231_06068 [Tremella mesenterica]|uniref:Prenyltransferase alpha-alpha toroid domain-containing protein n=1 Tax=Tremella mesenterica TaxID=5217 RepID=A0A4Q1BGJ1_TREME|nr:hypothetical protein M231_06068 [Tremella mesenterica]
MSEQSEVDEMEQEHVPAKQKTFKKNAHIAYFTRCLKALPSQAEGQDGNRITIAFFCLSALDLLGQLHTFSEEQRKGWIEWIWRLQSSSGGFRGSTCMDIPDENQPGHLPSTYTALMCLGILRAPLDRLDVVALGKFLRSCQAADGSFSPTPIHDDSPLTSRFENDLRMTYCASVIQYLINVNIDISSAQRLIHRCRTWEGGYASKPGVIESQEGGTTYCAIASLSLFSSNSESIDIEGVYEEMKMVEQEATLRWALQRQIGGFQGRPGKLEDVCYSFWIGATIHILGHPQLIDSLSDLSFLLSAQSPLGGFGKDPEAYPDPYHSYLALAAISLSHPDLGLLSLDPRLNVSNDTADYLMKEMKRIRTKI